MATEMVEFTRRLFAERKVKVDVEFSWGVTEAKAAEGLVDAIVEVTETGSSLRAAGLRIVEELLTSTPVLVANQAAWRDDWKQAKIRQIGVLIKGALDAESRVGIKMNVPRERLEGGDRAAAVDHRAHRRPALPVRQPQGQGMVRGRDRNRRAYRPRAVSAIARGGRRRDRRIPVEQDNYEPGPSTAQVITRPSSWVCASRRRRAGLRSYPST